MASVIRGDDDFDSEGIVTGTAKAWVNFNGTGTVAIRASYNVSSITDNGTGTYTVNFTNAFIDTSYSDSANAQDNNDSGTLLVSSHSGKTSSSIKYQLGSGNTDTPFDSVSVSAQFYR